MHNSNSRIRYIDSWRFIAVNIVIIGHLLANNNFSFLIEKFHFLSKIRDLGTTGVYIFFFISGYVIYMSLQNEQFNSKKIFFLKFYIKRIFRILPPLWLYLLVCFCLSLFKIIDMTELQIFKSGFFLCNLNFNDGCSWFGGHTWSLAYEEQFYIAAPLFFLLVKPPFSSKVLVILLIASVALSAILFSAKQNVIALFLMNINFLLTGCVTALNPRLVSYLRKMNCLTWLFILFIFIGIAYYATYPVNVYATILLYPALIGLIVIGTPTTIPIFNYFFNSPLISYLGKISYTTYLWQQLATFSWHNIYPLWILLMVLGVWIFAHFSWRYFELPLILYSRQFFVNTHIKNLVKK